MLFRSDLRQVMRRRSSSRSRRKRSPSIPRGGKGNERLDPKENAFEYYAQILGIFLALSSIFKYLSLKFETWFKVFKAQRFLHNRIKQTSLSLGLVSLVLLLSWYSIFHETWTWFPAIMSLVLSTCTFLFSAMLGIEHKIVMIVPRMERFHNDRHSFNGHFQNIPGRGFPSVYVAETGSRDEFNRPILGLYAGEDIMEGRWFYIES